MYETGSDYLTGISNSGLLSEETNKKMENLNDKIKMENAYDGHSAKRQRTDGEVNNQRGNQGENFYNFNNQQGGAGRGGGGGGGSVTGGSAGNRGNEEEKVNHVLLMTVINPAYPIDVEVIHTICSPHGQVVRIVIFKKNGVQTMVEFDNVDSAKRAKQMLHGADIYSGCCTLKVEYAKPTRLNVYKNDHESWDYTVPNLGKGNQEARHGPLLQEPRLGGAPIPYRGEGRGAGPPQAGFNGQEHCETYEGFGRGNSYGSYGGQGGDYNYNNSHERFGGNNRFNRDGFDNRADVQSGSARNFQGQHNGGRQQQGAVAMVYGLNHEKMNPTRLFNLFCLYGNVVRVKFLKSKEGCAMIQMGDSASVENAIRHLNNAVFFGCKMQLGYSKQAFLNDVQQPFELPDGSPSFQDFMGNRNNRFTNPESATKNRIQPPTPVLHFFNTPVGISEDELKTVFDKKTSPVPKTVMLFTSKTNSERSSSGLLEWENASEALESLILCNHTPIESPGGKFPYIMKLCFSSSHPRVN